MKKNIIAIHGVGETKEGDLIIGLAKSLGIPSIEFKKKLINQVEYTIGESPDGQYAIYESNWSKILKPERNIYSVLRHVGMLFISMLDISEATSSSFHKFLIRFLNIIIQGFAFGASTIYLINLVMYQIDFEDIRNSKNTVPAGLILIILFLFAFLNFKGIKYSKYFKVGILHIIPMFLCIIMCYFHYFDSDSLLDIAKKYRTLIGVVMALSWLFISLIYINKYYSSNELKYLTQLMFISMPYILLNSFSTIFTLIYAIFYKDVFVNEFYNLEVIEIGATICYFIIGLIPIVYALLYFLQFNDNQDYPLYSSINRKGKMAQHGISVLIYFSVFSLFSFYTFMLILKFLPGFEIDHNISLYEIYRISIVRVLPLIFWFVGPLALVLDVIGDVLFYISPKQDSKASIKKYCDNNLKTLINYCNDEENSVNTVVSHSWGTVIANEVLFELEQENVFNKKYNFLTLGSPLNSLCEKYLGYKPKRLFFAAEWINGYRDGDYIAGPINLIGITNLNLEKGGHVHYWSSEPVGELILKMTQNVK